MEMWVISYRDNELFCAGGVYGIFSTEEKAYEALSNYHAIFREEVKETQSHDESGFTIVVTDKGVYRVERFPVDEM